MRLKCFLASFLVFFALGTWFFFLEDFETLIFGQVHQDRLNRYLEKLIQAPKLELSIEDSTSKTNSKCLYYTCFDVYKCGGDSHKIKVHISDPISFQGNGQEVSEITQEYVEILQAIIESEYYTEKPDEACIFVPSLNLLNEANLDSELAAKALKKSENWGENGANNLIISFVTGNSDSLKLNHGKSMIAASGLSSFSYRNKFDISIPFYTPLQQNAVQIPKEKKYFLVSIQNEFQDGIKIFKRLKNTQEFVQDENGQKVTLLSVLGQAKYCLVKKEEKYSRLASDLLNLSLKSGCIPIVQIDHLVLPFSEVLDWKAFSFRFYEHDSVDKILDFLKEVSQQRYQEKLNRLEFIYEKYFKDLKTITKTTLDILNDRIHHGKTYRDWNLEYDLQNPLFMKNLPPISDGFTAVILTYDRLESLFQVVKSVAQTPSLAKVLVIWNNQDKSPPSLDEFPQISKPIKIIRTHKNLLTNRFYPFDDISTDAVLSMDDDIVMLTADELEFAYQVWREFPDRLVGFPSRTHVWNNATQQWKYESEWTNDVSMVLTGAAFYHKYWHYLFTSTPTQESKEIKNWLDQKMNCEDIAMNFLIANATRKSPIKVTPRKKFKCSTPQCINSESLSNYQSHLIERSECVNFLAKKYGHMPLRKAEFRADPVLFKDKFPDKLKSFANIGSL